MPLPLPIIPQPQCGRCHQVGTGQITLEITGSKQSYVECTEMAQTEQWWW